MSSLTRLGARAFGWTLFAAVVISCAAFSALVYANSGRATDSGYRPAVLPSLPPPPPAPSGVLQDTFVSLGSGWRATSAAVEDGQLVATKDGPGSVSTSLDGPPARLTAALAWSPDADDLPVVVAVNGLTLRVTRTAWSLRAGTSTLAQGPTTLETSARVSLAFDGDTAIVKVPGTVKKITDPSVAAHPSEQIRLTVTKRGTASAALDAVAISLA